MSVLSSGWRREHQPKGVTVSTLTDVAATDAKLCFIPWPEPVRVAFDADSDEALDFLLPRLGPSATVVLFHLSRRLRSGTANGFYDLRELGHACGFGRADVVRSTGLLVRTLCRLERFGLIRQVPGQSHIVEVRTKIPPLSRCHVAQLPADLQADAPSV
jgi:hypothetical protein